jgi:hypothetical protein
MLAEPCGRTSCWRPAWSGSARGARCTPRISRAATCLDSTSKYGLDDYEAIVGYLERLEPLVRDRFRRSGGRSTVDSR